jgi:predicted O-methyltransferase YrrM
MLYFALIEGMRKLAARLAGFCALNIYLPVWAMNKARRIRMRELRGAKKRHHQPTRLLQIRWSDALPTNSIYLVETPRRNGNVHLSELGVLAQAAAATVAGSQIIEIGTFDGRTTINLSVNAPPSSPVFTLDLPPDQNTQFQLAPGERIFVEKAFPGARIRNCRRPWLSNATKIVQLLGDSATFDWSAHFGKAGLVFIDGSHAKEYALKDSETAFRLVTEGGIVIWHDYGVWEGVTRALEELDVRHQLCLRHIRGTSLVIWRG